MYNIYIIILILSLLVSERVPNVCIIILCKLRHSVLMELPAVSKTTQYIYIYISTRGSKCAFVCACL